MFKKIFVPVILGLVSVASAAPAFSYNTNPVKTSALPSYVTDYLSDRTDYMDALADAGVTTLSDGSTIQTRAIPAVSAVDLNLDGTLDYAVPVEGTFNKNQVGTYVLFDGLTGSNWGEVVGKDFVVDSIAPGFSTRVHGLIPATSQMRALQNYYSFGNGKFELINDNIGLTSDEYLKILSGR